MVRNKRQNLKHLPLFFPGSTALLHSQLFYLLLSAAPNSAGGWGMGAGVSPYQFSAAPSFSHVSPAPAWGSSRGIQSSTNWSNVDPSQGLQLFTNCPSVGPSHGVPSFRNRLLQRGSPMGSRVQPANLLWRGFLSMGMGSLWAEAPFRASPPAAGWGPPWATVLISALPWPSMSCSGTICSTFVFSTGCREISPVAPGETPPPSSPTLVSAGLLLSHRLTPLFGCSSADCFFPLLNYVIPEVLPLSLMGSALASGGSVLEPAGTGSVGRGGSFWQLPTEATPLAPPLPEPCHANPLQCGRPILFP